MSSPPTHASFAPQLQLLSVKASLYHICFDLHIKAGLIDYITPSFCLLKGRNLCACIPMQTKHRNRVSQKFEWAPPPPPTKTYQTVKVVQIIIINVLSVQTKNTGWFEVTEKYFHQKKLSWKCSTKLSHDRKTSKISTAQRHLSGLIKKPLDVTVTPLQPLSADQLQQPLWESSESLPLQ